jgi:hypothetical protein
MGTRVGDLRPDQFWGDWKVVEVSWSGAQLRVVFAGNVPVTCPEEFSLGMVWFSFRGAERTFDDNALFGLGLTQWTWEMPENPFGTIPDVEIPFKIYGTNTLPADSWSTREW